MSQMPPPNQFSDQMPAGGYPQHPQKGGGGGKVVLIILAVLGVLGLVCAGVCGVALWGFGRAAQEAGKLIELELEKAGQLAKVEADVGSEVALNDEVNEKLGKPIEYLGSDHSEEIHLDSNSGTTATQSFSMKGTKAGAKVTFNAAWEQDEWVVKSIEVKCDDGTIISVPPPKQDPNDVTIPGIPLESDAGDTAK